MRHQNLVTSNLVLEPNKILMSQTIPTLISYLNLNVNKVMIFAPKPLDLHRN